MNVFWSPEALADRRSIWNYIATDNPPAAVRVDEAISESVSGLSSFPELGRPGLIPDTRELFPIGGYRLVYEIRDQEVWILAVVHTSRQWPTIES